MILDELTKITDFWAKTSQPKLMEANIAALGRTDTSYKIRLKNGAEISNVKGPTGLSVGKAVVLGSYPGKTKLWFILQEAAGGSDQTPTKVRV